MGTVVSNSGLGQLEIRRRSIHGRLARAAARLFAEQGFEATTVDQIAAEAGVALRTFYRYCSSKSDAVGPPIDLSLLQIVDTLHRTTPGQGLRSAVLEAVDHTVGDEADDLGRYLAKTLLTIPELMPRWLEANHQLQRGLVISLPQHFLVTAGLEAEIVAAVVTAAVSTAVSQAILTGDALEPLLRETLTYIPDPPARAAEER